jgi:hypothetical protein
MATFIVEVPDDQVEAFKSLLEGGDATGRVVDLPTLADKMLGEVYNTAPDIFSDVWSVLSEMGDMEGMETRIAGVIRGTQ